MAYFDSNQQEHSNISNIWNWKGLFLQRAGFSHIAIWIDHLAGYNQEIHKHDNGDIATPQLGF